MDALNDGRNEAGSELAVPGRYLIARAKVSLKFQLCTSIVESSPVTRDIIRSGEVLSWREECEERTYLAAQNNVCVPQRCKNNDKRNCRNNKLNERPPSFRVLFWKTARAVEEHVQLLKRSGNFHASIRKPSRYPLRRTGPCLQLPA